MSSSLPAGAMGGHFDVDDATMLGPARCQVETWFVRASSAGASNAHLGPACRVGPVEASVNIDPARAGGAWQWSAGPQIKWVMPTGLGQLAAGLVWSAAFDLSHGGRPAQTLYVPLTWKVTDTVAAHANAGADWSPSSGRTRRAGLALEWAASERITVIAEHIAFFGDRSTRIGSRIALGHASSLDVSVARVGPDAARAYAIGISHEFGR
jgi:hypothetical protein